VVFDVDDVGSIEIMDDDDIVMLRIFWEFEFRENIGEKQGGITIDFRSDDAEIIF